MVDNPAIPIKQLDAVTNVLFESWLKVVDDCVDFSIGDSSANRCALLVEKTRNTFGCNDDKKAIYNANDDHDLVDTSVFSILVLECATNTLCERH